MAKLPFVVAPKIKSELVQIGNETCGVIEIERRGYITAGEKAFMNTQMAQEDVTSKLVDLCQKVSSRYKVDMQKAYDAINTLFTSSVPKGLALKIQNEYSDDVSSIFSAMMVSEERKKLSQAFCMILYRVEGDFDAEELSNLDPELVNALSEFYEKEESRSIDKLADALADEGETIAPEIENLQKK